MKQDGDGPVNKWSLSNLGPPATKIFLVCAEQVHTVRFVLMKIPFVFTHTHRLQSAEMALIRPRTNGQE